MFEEFAYALTESELYAAIRRTRRQAGAVRLTVQTVLLAALAVGFGADFVWRREGGSALLALVMAALAAAQWVVPAVLFRREARALAAEGRPLRLKVSADEIAVDALPPQPLAACTFRPAADGLLLWTVDRNQAVAIPRRAVSDAVWQRLCELV